MTQPQVTAGAQAPVNASPNPALNGTNPTPPGGTVQPVPPPVPEAAQTEVPKEDADTSKRLALLARREKALQDERTKLKSEIEAERQKLTQESESVKKYRTVEERLKNRDWAVLKDLGFDYGDYTKTLLNNGEETTETKLSRLEKSMEEKFEKLLEQKVKEAEDQGYQARTQEQETQTLYRRQDIKAELDQDFQSESPNFKWLQFQDKPEDMVDEIVIEYYNDTLKNEGRGRVLKYAEAAKIAEDYLATEAKKRFGSYEKAAAMMKHLFEIAEEQKLEVKPKVAQPPGVPKTLTNEISPPPPTDKPLNYEESKKAAAKLLRWT
jgi:hypothetical protein